MKKKILWIGTYANDDYFDEMENGTYIQYAANRVQSYYLNELKKINDLQLEVWSALVTVPFMQSKKINFNYREDKLDNKITIRNVGFLNIKYLSIFSQTRALSKLLRQYEKNHNLDDTLIIVYSMRIPYLRIANKIKNKYKNVTVINIVPDLPEYMSNEKSLIRSVLVKCNKYVLNKEVKNVDGFVLYTKPMADKLNINNNKYIVIEGLIEEKKDLLIDQKNNSHKICLYAGGVNIEYGIKNLVEGFISANLYNVELHIYGNGNYVNELTEISKKYSNIKYKGCLSPDQMYEKMKQADLLINPRSNEEEYTKFSCPSKIFEYMLSGTPVAMTLLEGIPSEYFRYVYPIEDSTRDGIASTLKKIFTEPESKRRNLGIRARKYLLKNKNSNIQTKKILKFAESIQTIRRKNC